MSNYGRRDFLKLAASAGLAYMVPSLPRGARAQDMGQTPGGDVAGPYWIFIHATGGWDPTLICDPKGRGDGGAPVINAGFETDAIIEQGNLLVPPVAQHAQFYERHFEKTVVINGVDTETVDHTVGTRHTFSGKLGGGYPSLASLIAARGIEGRPGGFVTFGGYDFTAGVVPSTRLGEVRALAPIAYPNSVTGQPDGETFHSRPTLARLRRYQGLRKAWLDERYTLPRSRNAIGQLFGARMGGSAVADLERQLNGNIQGDPLQRQVQLSLASFRAGVARTANLTLGNFDTHGDHDNRHIPLMSQVLAAADYAWQEAERMQMSDKLTVVIASDFARTPGYNGGNGKDHWPVTSMMVMSQAIDGNRTVGRTDYGQNPYLLDPVDLRPMRVAQGDEGRLGRNGEVDANAPVRLTPEHVHVALRKLAGLERDALSLEQFPLRGGALDLPILRYRPGQRPPEEAPEEAPI